MKKLTKMVMATLLIAGMTFGLVGCGGNATEGDKPATESSTQGEKKVIKAGTEATFAPFEFQDESGKLTGFDVDLLQAIADEIGYTLEIKHLEWKGHDPALNTGAVDAIISAVTITDERKQEVDFSEPYFEAWQTIVVKEGSSIKGKEDLAGKVIGAQANTTGQYTAEGLKVKEIHKFPSATDALMELRNGGNEAVVTDYPVALNYIKNNPEAKLVAINDDFDKETYGIKVKKGNTELVQKLNEGLAAVKANGTYDTLFEKYFGKKPGDK